MSLTLAAGALAAAVVTSSGPAYIGPDTARDRILVTPAPYEVARVNAGRDHWGLLWHSSTPVGSRTPIGRSPLSIPGPAAYGAPDSAWDERVVVRVVHTPVTISPWQQIDQAGLGHLERARAEWLREQGYTHRVRTHVNTALFNRGTNDRSAQKIEPGAVIHIRDRGPGPIASTAR